MLDTNTCIYYLKGEYPSIREKFKQINNNQIIISAIVEAELLFGAEKSLYKKRNMEVLKNFLHPFSIANFDSLAAIKYSQIRSSLERAGTPIGSNDLFIASIAIANNAILVTHNTKEFSRVPGLHLEDWVT
jgi:tRNA(fMet)-specific endonuclease VapC